MTTTGDDALDTLTISTTSDDDAATFVRTHGDSLVTLVERLPLLFASSAKSLEEAAADAREAASSLTGVVTGAAATDDVAAGGVKAIAELSGEALEACRRELSEARVKLVALADELEGLPIPNITPKFSKIMGHQIVTGLDFGEGNMLATASAQLRDGAAHFDGVGDQLAEVAAHLRSIGALVDESGGRLSSAAEKLETTANSLGRFPE